MLMSREVEAEKCDLPSEKRSRIHTVGERCSWGSISRRRNAFQFALTSEKVDWMVKQARAILTRLLEPTDWRSSDITDVQRWLLERDDAGEIAWNIKSARSACLR